MVRYINPLSANFTMVKHTQTIRRQIAKKLISKKLRNINYQILILAHLSFSDLKPIFL